MVTFVSAQDSTENKDASGMQAMGVPEQMQEIAFLAGSWKVTGRMKMETRYGQRPMVERIKIMVLRFNRLRTTDMLLLDRPNHSTTV